MPAINLTKPPKNSKIKTPPLNTLPLPLNIGLYTDYGVRDIISGAIQQTLREYLNNRGRGSVSAQSFKRARSDEFNAKCLKVICCLNNDSNPKHLILADGHGSWQGTIFRYWDGNLSEEDLNCKRTIEIYSRADLESLYRSLNTNSSHKSKDKIDNPDTVFGDLLHKQLSVYLNKEENKILGLYRKVKCSLRFHNFFGTLFLALSNEYNIDIKEWYPPEIYRLRNAARDYQNEAPGCLTVAKNKMECLVKYCKQYCKLYNVCKSQWKEVDGVMASIKSTQFFAFFIAEKFTIKPRLSDEMDKLSAKIAHKIASIKPLANVLTNGNAKVIEEKYEEMIKFLSC